MDKQLKLTLYQVVGPWCLYGAHLLLIRTGAGRRAGTKEQLQHLVPRTHGCAGGSEGKRRFWGFTYLLEAPVPPPCPLVSPQDKGGRGNAMTLASHSAKENSLIFLCEGI